MRGSIRGHKLLIQEGPQAEIMPVLVQQQKTLLGQTFCKKKLTEDQSLPLAFATTVQQSHLQSFAVLCICKEAASNVATMLYDGQRTMLAPKCFHSQPQFALQQHQCGHSLNLKA